MWISYLHDFVVVWNKFQVIVDCVLESVSLTFLKLYLFISNQPHTYIDFKPHPESLSCEWKFVHQVLKTFVSCKRNCCMDIIS